MILTITGPSASGKTTLCNLLVETGKFKAIPGYVTRPPREKGDENYIFISDEEFESQRKEFCEVIELYGNKYATKWNDILAIKEEGKFPLVVLSPEGVEQYKEVSKTLGIPLVKLWLGNKVEVLMQRAKGREGRDFEKELSWYKTHSWDIVVNSFTEETREAVLHNVQKFCPLVASRRVGRIWT